MSVYVSRPNGSFLAVETMQGTVPFVVIPVEPGRRWPEHGRGIPFYQRPLAEQEADRLDRQNPNPEAA